MSKNGTWMKFTRTIGVVVEKTESDLTVMFRTNKGEYIIKKYAISNNAVFFDDKELAKPSATIGSANLHVVRDVTTGVDIIVGDGVDVIPNLDESTGVDIVTSTGVEPVGKRSK